MTGPYHDETEVYREPLPLEISELFQANAATVAQVRAAVTRHLEAACAAAGVELAGHELTVLIGMADRDVAPIQIVIDLIGRAYTAGRGQALPERRSA